MDETKDQYYMGHTTINFFQAPKPVRISIADTNEHKEGNREIQK